MGFYSMTWSIMPMGGMLAGALASIVVVGAPFAVAIGGSAVAAFALGPALFNRKIRNLDAVMAQIASPSGPPATTVDSTGKDGAEMSSAGADPGPRP
jgi:hypothetical protein